MTTATLTSSTHTPIHGWVSSIYATTRQYVDRRPSVPSPLAPWEESVTSALAALERLTPNWDTYGAFPVTRTHSTRAAKFLRLVMAEDSVVPDVVPLSDGGVQLEWYLPWGRFDFISDSESRDPILLKQEGEAEALEIEWTAESRQIAQIRQLIANQ